MRYMKTLLWGFVVMITMGAVAFAADISVNATVSSNPVALGTGLQYTVTVKGSQDATPPNLPLIDGVDARYSGPASRVSVINGAYSVEQSFNYVLLPTKEGKFTIPSITVDVKGQPFATEPVTVEVLSAGAQDSGSASGDTLQQEVESKIKLLMALGKDHAYMGEAVPLTVRIYVNQLSLQDLSFPEITQEGFQMEPFAEPKQFVDSLQGVNWHVVEFSTLIYPSRTGELLVAPALVRGALLFKTNQQRDNAGGIFDDGFFGNFFSSYQKRPITVTSRSAGLNVLALPQEGKPADFSGAVGAFDLAVEASPLKVKAGDPVTLRINLSGTGNMKAVKMPVFLAEGFKVYDPQIKDEPGLKALEQVIIPTDVKIKEIPLIRFSYFDSLTGAYKAIERGPFSIEVAAPASGEEFQAVGFSQPSMISVPETLGRDIVFIKDNPGQLEKRSAFSKRNIVFYVLLALYLQVWAGLLIFYLYRYKMTHDPKFARQIAASRQAHHMFNRAKEDLSSGNVRAFYDTLERGLRDYFVQRLEIPPGQTDMQPLEAALRARKVDAKHISAIEDVFAAAERVRFAGMPMGEAEMRTHLADADDIVRAVERRS